MSESLVAPAPVTFIGLGVMGAAMAANILRAGFALTVHSRTREKTAALEAAGARWAESAAEAARGAAFIGICVPDTPDVEAVLFGPEGVARGVAPGAVVVDFSTIAAASATAFAARLAAETGAVLLDSPVSGGPAGARDGTLSCMVGGDEAAFARAAPVFESVGRTLIHLGPSGSGQVCKSANQLVVATTMLAVAEALALGAKAGLDGAALHRALLGGTARSFVMENHAPRMLEGRYAPGFRAELMRKDLRLSAGAMRDHGVFAPATALTASVLEALVSSGRGDLDSSSVGALVRQLSGLPN